MNSSSKTEAELALAEQLRLGSVNTATAAIVDALIKKVLCHHMSRGQIKAVVPDMLAAVKEVLV